MSTPETQVPEDNEEAIRAWDGPLFDRFVRSAGFGDTARRIAGLVGPEGEAIGIDAAPRFIEAAAPEAAGAGASNARFEVADVVRHGARARGRDPAPGRRPCRAPPR